MVGRSCVVLVALAAIYLAHDRDSSILHIVANAWAGFGAAFGPLVVFALHWPRMNLAGAMAGDYCWCLYRAGVDLCTADHHGWPDPE